jgi:hypothetical protein
MTDKATTTKPKKKRGRPTVVTPEIEERVLAEVIRGAFVGQACAKVGIGYTTLVKREISDPDFGRLLARARVAGADLHVEQADAAIRKAKTHEDIAKARELAIHRRWRASKLVPAYSDRIGVDMRADVSVRGESEKPWAEMAPAEKHRYIAKANMLLRDIAKAFEVQGLKRAARLLLAMNEALYKDGREMDGLPVPEGEPMMALPAPRLIAQPEKEINPVREDDDVEVI